MAINLNSIAKSLRAKTRREALAGSVTPSVRLKREPSVTEREATYHPYGYHLAACFHDKLYITPCTACGRTNKDAIAELNKLLAKLFR